MRSKNFVLLLSVFLFLFCNQYNSSKPSFDNVSDSPQLFLPEVFDSVRNFRDITITADYSKIYFSEIVDGKFSIMEIEFKNNNWTKPEVSSFSGEYFDAEPKLNYDESKLFFTTKRSFSNKDMTNDFDIWVVEKDGDKWINPKPLNENINTPQMEYFPSPTISGKLYFGRNDKAMTRGDVFVADKMYKDTTKLSSNINGESTSFNAFVDPEEKYIIFSIYLVDGESFHSDMFISFNNNGEWSKAINLGPEINSPALDHSPYVTKDGKYFFFASNRNKIDSTQFGNHNIFFMKADFIQKLK